MAAATATVAKDFSRPQATPGEQIKILSGTVTVVGDYATGGVAVSGISNQFKDLLRVVFSGATLAATYDHTNNKILLYGDVGTAALGVLAEPNGVTLASTVFDFIAVGR